MTTKEELINKIKQWVTNDDSIKELQREIKSYREKKKKLTDELISIMKNNEIDCFDINSGKILFCQNKVKTPLNKKTLLFSLEKYFKNTPSIDSEKLRDFILENREVKLKENLKRK